MRYRVSYCVSLKPGLGTKQLIDAFDIDMNLDMEGSLLSGEFSMRPGSREEARLQMRAKLDAFEKYNIDLGAVEIRILSWSKF